MPPTTNPRPIDTDATESVPELTPEYIEEQRLYPLTVSDGRLVVLHAGRPDPQAVAELESLSGVRVELREVSEDEFARAATRRSNGNGGGRLVAAGDPTTAALDEDEEAVAHDLEMLANQAPVVRLVNTLLVEAVEAGASDIHLEAGARDLSVRFRLDGVLRDAPTPPAEMRAAVISRLKIMAELDIAERRLPQDGRVRLRVEDRELDVRVSTLPTLRGESVVLRLLDPAGQRVELDGLGLAEDTRSRLLAFANRPRGVLLATGPTGSGKTTTLYALLERIRTGREKIVSVEDPVEYEFPGVAQVPVNVAGGLTFPRALRSILRQDPDVLLVGEMRDPETAEICTQAALTGHLVLSTLHTNDAPSALTRLVDLGVADYLVASTVEAVLAQRLVRCVCEACAENAEPDAVARRAMEEDGWTPPTDVPRGRGCDACHGTGYRDRTGIYELLRVDDEIRTELLRRRGSAALRVMALERGMRSLREDGWRQVAAGVTTPEEVLRVAGA